MTDGTATGTIPLYEFDHLSYNFVEQNGDIFFFANDGVHGSEMWTSDGTVAGTTMVVDLNQGSADGVSLQMDFLSTGTKFSSPEIVLSSSDGTAAGTALKDIQSREVVNCTLLERRTLGERWLIGRNCFREFQL